MKKKLILLLTLGLILIGGWFYYQYSKTANWNTYKSDEWEVEIKYPSSYNFRNYAPKKSDNFFNTTLVTLHNPKDDGEYIPTFMISIMRQPITHNGPIYTSSMEAAQKLFEGYGDNAVIKSTRIDNYESAEVTFDCKKVGVGCADKEYIVVKDGYIYSIMWDLTYSEFSLVTKSFKFTK